MADGSLVGTRIHRLWERYLVHSRHQFRRVFFSPLEKHELGAYSLNA